MLENLKTEEPAAPAGRMETGLLFPELAQPVCAPASVPAEPEASPLPAGAQSAVSAPRISEPIADWKRALREEFECWLADLDSAGEPLDTTAEAQDAPDLYSFYEQLVASNAEGRKANRRTAEAISQWGEIVARFDGALAPLRDTIASLAAAQPKPEQLSRPHCLALIEVLDRLSRIATAFASPPPKQSWWKGSDGAWRQHWETQQQAFSIVVTHLEEFLKQQGVTRLEALGRPFDPASMNAVAVANVAHQPDQTVLEELAPGYQRLGELLRPAQVKVNRKSESQSYL